MKLVLHSVSYSGGWAGQCYLTLSEFLHRARRLGFDYVEIMAKPPHLDIAAPIDGTALREDLKSAGVECACLAAYTDFTVELSGGLVPYAALQVSYIRELARLAAQIGCPLIRAFTGNEVPGVPFWKQWQACVVGIQACAAAAAEYGVTIGVQNHHDIAATASAMCAFLDDVDRPNVKAMYDAWVPADLGEPLAEVAQRMAPRMAYTTVADYQYMERVSLDLAALSFEREPKVRRAVLMGDGHIDYRAFFAALKSAGYEGCVCYEMCSELRGGGALPALDAHATRFLEYMRTL